MASGKLKTIKLGTQGLTVTELGYGCMGLTTAYGTKLPDEDVVNMLKKVYEHGVTFWDTANIYAYPQLTRLLHFQSPVVCQEELIGKALKDVGRENIVIATKTGIKISVFPTLKLTTCGEPAFVKQQCEDSLRRLGVDHLDLFYIHRIDPNIPIEITMTAMKELVEAGKVKYLGLSECSAKTLRRAHKIHPITCIQMEWSLWARQIEKELVPTCAELGVGVVAYSPLGRGFFAGVDAMKAGFAKDDFRQTQDRMKGESLDENLKMLHKVEEIAAAKNVTSSQLALAWIQKQQSLLKGAGVVAIPGTTKEKNLISNVESLSIELTAEDMATLEKAVPPEEVSGGRYDEQGEFATFEDDSNVELSPDQAAELGITI